MKLKKFNKPKSKKWNKKSLLFHKRRRNKKFSNLKAKWSHNNNLYSKFHNPLLNNHKSTKPSKFKHHHNSISIPCSKDHTAKSLPCLACLKPFWQTMASTLSLLTVFLKSYKSTRSLTTWTRLKIATLSINLTRPTNNRHNKMLNNQLKTNKVRSKANNPRSRGTMLMMFYNKTLHYSHPWTLKPEWKCSLTTPLSSWCNYPSRWEPRLNSTGRDNCIGLSKLMRRIWEGLEKITMC